MYTIYHFLFCLTPTHLTSLPPSIQFLDQATGIIKGSIPMQLEILPIDLSHIIAVIQPMNVMLQCSQLVILTLIKRQNRDSVVQLHSIRIRRIIDKDYLR